MLPTLRQLQFLTSLARNGSFSRAADECCVSQSTLSAGVKELETILGAALVDRSSRQFGLTPVGEDVAARADDVIARAEDIVRVAAQRPPLTGDLRLGMIPTIGPFLLPRLMPQLTEASPTLRPFLREDLTEALVADLRAGRLDMAILAMPVETAGLDTLIFAVDPFVVACAPGHPFADRDHVSFDELSEAKLLLLEDGHCLRDHALSACRLQDRRVAEAFGATSLFTLAQMVRAGLGVTLLPQLAVDAGLAESTGLLTRPLVGAGTDEAPSRDLGIAWRSGSGREDEAQMLASLMPGLLPR